MCASNHLCCCCQQESIDKITFDLTSSVGLVTKINKEQFIGKVAGVAMSEKSLLSKYFTSLLLGLGTRKI